MNEYRDPTPQEPVNEYRDPTLQEPVNEYRDPTPREPVNEYRDSTPREPVNEYRDSTPKEPVNEYRDPTPRQPVNEYRDDKVYDAEIVDENTQSYDEAPTPEEIEQDKDSADSAMSSIFEEEGDNVKSYSDFMGNVKQKMSRGISEEDMGVETVPVQDENTNVNQYASMFDESNHTDPEENKPKLKDAEQFRRENNVQSNAMDGDGMEFINQAMEERARAEKRRKKQTEKSLEEDKKNAPTGLSALENLGISGVSKETLRKDKESQDILNKTNAMSEDAFNEKGDRKNFREYLSESDQRDQVISENVQKDFGNMKAKNIADNIAQSEDSRYVGKGTGRIILCTAGKGGVGKSLVSNGLAAALSLARAKELKENPNASKARTWLIESDYNSPQLAAAYKTRTKHLGNVAEALSYGKHLDNDALREAIEDNCFIDPNTGVNILACPPLNSNTKNSQIPYAISLAVKYASDSGDDVIIDHGNLTTGEYSTLDRVLAMDLAHRVVIVCNMGCIPETQSALSILTERTLGSSVSPRVPQSISVVLNSARKEQLKVAQNQLKPFHVLPPIPPIDALRAENSITGDTYLSSAPKEVLKEVIDYCGMFLTELGYHSMKKYFSVKNYFAPKRKGKKSFFRKLADRIAGEG